MAFGKQRRVVTTPLGSSRVKLSANRPTGRRRSPIPVGGRVGVASAGDGRIFQIASWCHLVVGSWQLEVLNISELVADSVGYDRRRVGRLS